MFFSFQLAVLLSFSNSFAVERQRSLLYQPAAVPEALNQCYDSIQARLREPGKLRVAISLGYSDTVDEGLDLVTDKFTLNQVGYQLTKACTYEGQGFCEFKPVSEIEHEPYLYVREIKGPYNDSLKVEVYVMNSSYDLSNSDNVGKYKVEQTTKTANARSFYEWAVTSADAVFYEGHSRDGGGPDFAPPHRATNGKVNYPWYHKNHPGLNFLIQALNKTEAPPIYFGLMSCASDLHFHRKLAPYLKTSHMIMSTRVVEAYWTKEAVMTSMESLLNFECPEQLKSRLRSHSFIVRSIK